MKDRRFLLRTYNVTSRVTVCWNVILRAFPFLSKKQDGRVGRGSVTPHLPPKESLAQGHPAGEVNTMPRNRDPQPPLWAQCSA